MTKEKKDNLFYVKIFVSIFAVIFFIAIGIRIYGSYINRNFTYNSFNILIVADNYVGVIGFDAKEARFNSAIVTENLKNIKKRNILVQSINFVIPIHGYIVYPEGIDAPAPTQRFLSSGNIQKIYTDIRIEKKNITLFDWFRMYFITKKIDAERVLVKTYASITDLNKLLPIENEPFFRDSEVTYNKTSIQIVNGTSINGLGNRVADIFSRTGFNVVSVVTSSSDESAIYYNDDVHFKEAELISKSFNFPIIKSDDYAIASVTIVLGEDQELLLEELTY